ncbi:hypothetical protein [Roseovarius aestuariivivens]|uniref:hypothetical protein n=1 Tax=Roseovarius aestuariivivens TaxID=1888910 RepID=UPI0010800D88|nr:hypothetical protein [Roseovarius aestuariivivens]
MHRLKRYLCAAAVALAGAAAPGWAEDLRLAAPASLVDSGLLKYVLPRFSLKTGVRIEVVGPEEPAQIVLSPEADGPRVFSGPNATWRLGLRAADNADAVRFADWLTSEIGQRTVTSYTRDGTAPFTLPKAKVAEVAPVTFDGDPVQGAKLSVVHCARCHAVSEATRMNAIGSTPSFFVLRAMRDWDSRFAAFYALNPHPAFTQVDEVTPPFPINRPSPIVPVEITLDELEAILAYVNGMPPADLGAPIRHQ